MYDIAIIGSGVVGSLIARELSQYRLKICLLEKESDVAMGTSKANSSIAHSGYDAHPNSLKATLNVYGNKLMDSLTKELDVPFKRIGSLLLAFKEEDLTTLKNLYEQGLTNGVEGLRLLNPSEVYELEPNISNEIVGALHAPSAGIVCPYQLTVAAAENAVSNGVNLFCEFEVSNVSFCDVDSSYTIFSKSNHSITAKRIINVTGVNADKIANLFNDFSFNISPRKGEYLLFDKSEKQPANMIVFQPPTKMGKGILVTPTIDNNFLVGPTAFDTKDRNDSSTSAEGMTQIIEGSKKSIPSLNFKHVITSFSGLRAVSSRGDFIIEPSSVAKNLIHVAGIESPGLTASPAIAKKVCEILLNMGQSLIKKEDFNPYRVSIIRFRDMNNEERDKMIKKNPAYGKIVCRCELVTEAEIVESIKRPAGAKNVDAVKRRTRAGMGRCQGGFCLPKVADILSRELEIPLEEVTKFGGDSRILFVKTK